MIDSLAPQPSTAADLPTGDLPPAVDAAQRIVWRLSFIEFPWDINKALEFALLRTYAVPSISGLLARTREFEDRTTKRYDDTALLIREVLRNGLDSERARRSFARINGMHGRFRIADEDFLYVLSTFVFSPIDWIANFGRRPLSQAEEQAWFAFWNEFGRRMRIPGLCATLAEFRAFAMAYEATHFQFAPSNRLIAERTLDLVLSMYFVPRPLLPAGRQAALAICDAPLVAALGFAEPSPGLRRIARGALRWRRAILRWLPPNSDARWLVFGAKTYPEGYNIEELGTFPAARTGSAAADRAA